jgi:hypothetical protein
VPEGPRDTMDRSARAGTSTDFPRVAPAANRTTLWVDRASVTWWQAEHLGVRTVAQHRMLGTVQTPPDFRVHQIGSAFLLGRWRDALDVEHVQLYELIKQ